jgi:hypothetical protein
MSCKKKLVRFRFIEITYYKHLMTFVQGKRFGAYQIESKQ